MTEERKAALAALQERIRYRFQDPGLLDTALTHRSFINENPSPARPDNERLEFLGDAVLELCVSDTLMRQFPDHAEGRLSRLRASIVNEQPLAELARSFGIGDCLLLGRGEESSGGRTKPSLLADALEAILAAIYLDGGFDAARAFLERQFAADIQKLSRSGVPDARDAKTHLQEYLQARGHPTPRYQILKESGPAHRRNFLVGLLLDGKLLERGRGRTRKAAEQAAARKVLEALTDESESNL
jgi:ribonuclease-3